jgi:hypothetical protein
VFGDIFLNLSLVDEGIFNAKFSQNHDDEKSIPKLIIKREI